MQPGVSISRVRADCETSGLHVHPTSLETAACQGEEKGQFPVMSQERKLSSKTLVVLVWEGLLRNLGQGCAVGALLMMSGRGYGVQPRRVAQTGADRTVTLNRPNPGTQALI